MPNDFWVIETIINCFIVFKYEINVVKHKTIEFISFACLIKTNIQQFRSIEQSFFGLILVQRLNLMSIFSSRAESADEV